MNRRLRISGILILVGLGAELLSFAWPRPAAFIVFLVVSGTFLLAGMVLFLFSIAAGPAASTTPHGEEQNL